MVVLRATSLFGENKLRPAARVIKASCRPVFWLYTSSVLEKAAVSSQQSGINAHQTNLLIREEKDTASKKQEHNKLIPRNKKDHLWVHYLRVNKICLDLSFVKVMKGTKRTYLIDLYEHNLRDDKFSHYNS